MRCGRAAGSRRSRRARARLLIQIGAILATGNDAVVESRRSAGAQSPAAGTGASRSRMSTTRWKRPRSPSRCSRAMLTRSPRPCASSPAAPARSCASRRYQRPPRRRRGLQPRRPRRGMRDRDQHRGGRRQCEPDDDRVGPIIERGGGVKRRRLPTGYRGVAVRSAVVLTHSRRPIGDQQSAARRRQAASTNSDPRFRDNLCRRNKLSGINYRRKR